MAYSVELDIAGRTLRLETGRVAKQADGSIWASYGDTVVLATAVASQNAKPGIDFLPLTVDYQEKAYAAGKIPGGYFKREGRPSEKEVLTSRLIDRPLRPLFPEGYYFETQVIASVLSCRQDRIFGRHRHYRRLRGAGHIQHSVSRSDCRSQNRSRQWRVRRESGPGNVEGQRIGSGRRRHGRCRHDGRGRRK